MEYIIEMHKRAETYRKSFSRKHKDKGTLCFGETEKGKFWSFIRIDNKNSDAYLTCKDKSILQNGLVFKRYKPVYKTKWLGTFDPITGEHAIHPSWDRAEDAEAKFLEHINREGISGEATMFVENPMCDSCIGVLIQYEDKHPNTRINIVEKKRKGKTSFQEKKKEIKELIEKEEAEAEKKGDQNENKV